MTYFEPQGLALSEITDLISLLHEIKISVWHKSLYQALTLAIENVLSHLSTKLKDQKASYLGISHINSLA